MEKNYEVWNETLVELNNFSCKIEFLQSRMRNTVVTKKSMDKAKYFELIDNLFLEHKHNLCSIIDRNNKDVLIELVPMKNYNLRPNSNKYFGPKQC